MAKYLRKGVSPPWAWRQPHSSKRGLQIFGNISKGGPGEFPNFRGGLDFLGGLGDFDQLHISKSMSNIVA